MKIGKNWKPALLLPDDSDKSNYRSYKIQLPSGKITRRNRRHLLRTSEENIYQRNPDEDEDISLREQKQFSEEQALPEQFIGNPDVDIPSVEPATPSGKPRMESPELRETEGLCEKLEFQLKDILTKNCFICFICFIYCKF